MKVFTIGTDHRTNYDFARLLMKYGVEVIFDVRRTPEAHEDYFRRDGLQALAAGQGIDYVFMGNELGGPRENDYQNWTSTDEFKRGIDIIRTKASKRACCILCAERTPESCHRRTIAEHLSKLGIEVVHILDEKSLWTPPPPGPAPHPRTREPRNPGTPPFASRPARGRWHRPGQR